MATIYDQALAQFKETFWSMSKFDDCWGDNLYQIVVGDCDPKAKNREIYDKAYKDFVDSLSLYELGKKIALVVNNPDNDQDITAYELAEEIYGLHEDHLLDDLYAGIDDNI